MESLYPSSTVYVPGAQHKQGTWSIVFTATSPVTATMPHADGAQQILVAQMRSVHLTHSEQSSFVCFVITSITFALSIFLLGPDTVFLWLRAVSPKQYEHVGWLLKSIRSVS